MQAEGADLIDVGAVSTAPGSPPVDEAAERERLFPALNEILDNLEIPVSVDTQRSAIASKALSSGAACINDVSGLFDPAMARTVAQYDGSLIIMASNHVPGDLLNLNQIIPLLGERVRTAVDAGVSLQKIAVDPGVGKWIPKKTPEHDLAILDGFRRLRVLDRPILAALSRKSFIGDRLLRPDPVKRLAGSLAATAIAVYNGAHMVRTHDVSASLDAVRMAQAIRGQPARAGAGEMEVEVLDHLGLGHGSDRDPEAHRSGRAGMEHAVQEGIFQGPGRSGLEQYGGADNKAGDAGARRRCRHTEIGFALRSRARRGNNLRHHRSNIGTGEEPLQPTFPAAAAGCGY